MAKSSEFTSFTKDVQGRYLCNDFSEVEAWRGEGGRPFDFIIVGGGTFGAAIAEHLWFRQREVGGGLRTLVVEAGLFTLPEHVQNTGILGLSDPRDPFSLDLSVQQPERPRNEVWGIPWISNIPFKGLAYTLGGRSLYWGGWSPRLLNEEMATWPAATVADLNGRYFDESSRQIGVAETNDFIFGELHRVLRKNLFNAAGGIKDVIPLPSLPPSPLLKPNSDPLDLLGLPSSGGLSPDDLLNMLKLEAPLAVQARPPHAGFFPLNKFSTVPLMMKAARTASTGNGVSDGNKDFMVLPDTHVLSLSKERTSAGTWRITGVNTNRGHLDLAPGGTVVIALGTIENARLALASFEGSGLATLPLIGKNLIAHLRSNLVIRVPRTAIPGLSSTTNELQTSALFVKGRATRANGDIIGTFHLQIAASGGGSAVGGEDELYRKVPDIDFYDQLRTSNDTHVAIAIRGLGEMEPADMNNIGLHPSHVDLDARRDEYGVPRAMVTLAQTPRDDELWQAMDAAMVGVAAAFAPGQAIPPPGHDLLGTTHHETGTLRMDADPTRGVTDANGRFHYTENLYAAGPALFPSIGSPNPMLTGIALSRRTGDLIMAPAPFGGDPGFEVLFDGTSLGDWMMSTISNQPGRSDPGGFRVRRGVLESRAGSDLGLLWLTRPTPERYVFRLQWMMTAADDNSGVFFGFPDPRNEGYDNTAYVGVNFGLELQIDELARPDNAQIHRTAAIYSFKGPDLLPPTRPIGEWNGYELVVDGPDITVSLNGQAVNQFHFAGDPQSPRRAQPSTAQDPRFIGLQTHTGRLFFRRIQWKAL
ncbi:family 16 glycoside hydrolase [Rhizobium mesoamericanum]|uniref:family 16 glycoside hydrolase n=1 Tax=Rhizobium mesoamericanum TaxID=1079800 RepID=UPI000429B84E|nr:family 16 glycoside hydrolase [Rhizobium mesoamericanum]